MIKLNGKKMEKNVHFTKKIFLVGLTPDFEIGKLVSSYETEEQSMPACHLKL
jgi:hypothetical protein